MSKRKKRLKNPVELCKLEENKSMFWCPENERLGPIYTRGFANYLYYSESPVRRRISLCHPGTSASREETFNFWRRSATFLGHRIEGLRRFPAIKRINAPGFSVGPTPGWFTDYHFGCCIFTYDELEKLWYKLADIFGYDVFDE